MKTLSLAEKAPSIEEILQLARSEEVLLEDRDGERYLLSRADDFEAEVELLRRHHEFLSFLDQCKSDDSAIPFEEIERRYR